MFIYVMVAKPYMKIGISRDVQRRIKEVQTGCPVRITRCIFMNVGNTQQAETLEKLLHKRYAACNTWGEWFTYSLPRVRSILALFPEAQDILLPTVIKDNGAQGREYSNLILDMYHRNSKHELMALENEIKHLSDKALKRKLLRKLSKYLTKLTIRHSRR